MNTSSPVHARFRFHARLAGLLRRPAVAGEIDCPFVGNPAIKDTIEAAGVPHTEVDLIFVDGRSVNFTYRLQSGDRVDVYPPGARLSEGVSGQTLHYLSPALPVPVRFVLDVHLGKLARRLRLLGFDALYRNDYDDAQIVRLGGDETRIILTRDRGLLKHSVVRHGYLLRSQQSDAQVHEVLQRYGLYTRVTPLRRCPACNGPLLPVEKQEILHRLEPKTARYYDQFVRCDGCTRLYWRGSHYDRITAWIALLMQQGEKG